MKTSQEQKIRRKPFIQAVFVLDKTLSYKWYSLRLIFPCINLEKFKKSIKKQFFIREIAENFNNFQGSSKRAQKFLLT